MLLMPRERQAMRIHYTFYLGSAEHPKGCGTMKQRIGAPVKPLFMLLLCTLPGFSQAPKITNVTNAAIPALDYPVGPVNLVPGSMASIFGTNLADSVVSITPPWQET